MSDDVKQQIPEESNEFENFEKSQPVQAPQQQKPQENFDVKDEFGKILETGQQAFSGATDPAKIQQQQQQDEAKQKQVDAKKLAVVNQYINQMVADEQRFKQTKREEEEKKMEEDQEQKEEKQEVEIKKQKKEQSFNEQHIRSEQTKAERKLGVGG